MSHGRFATAAGLLLLLVLSGCSNASTKDDGGSGSPPSALVEDTPATAAPTPEPTPEPPQIGDLAAIFDLDPATLGPAIEPEGLLSGAANRIAARQVAEALAAAGLDMSSTSVYVLPIAGSQEELLVLEMRLTPEMISVGEDQSSGLTDEQNAAVLAALADAGELELANITRVVINFFSYQDGTGGILFTMTMPMDVVAGLAGGTITQAEAEPYLLFEVRPLAQ